MRVVLAEDSGLLREVLTGALIDRGVEVVTAVPDGEQLLRVVETTPDLDAAIVDVRMPPTFTDEGLRAALVLRRQHPTLGVLILSQYVEERYATELLAGGARGLGYLLKDSVGDLAEFADALARVASGGTTLARSVVWPLAGDAASSGLTARCQNPIGVGRCAIWLTVLVPDPELTVVVWQSPGAVITDIDDGLRVDVRPA